MVNIDSDWIRFLHAMEREKLEREKSQSYTVRATKDNRLLGKVRWLEKWKQYVYFPCNKTLYSSTLLLQIADCIDKKTKKRKRCLNT